MVGVDAVTFIGEVDDECIDDLLGFALDATNMTMTIEVNEDYYVGSITLTYETIHGAVEVVSVYKY